MVTAAVAIIDPMECHLAGATAVAVIAHACPLQGFQAGSVLSLALTLPQRFAVPVEAMRYQCLQDMLAGPGRLARRIQIVNP